MKVTLREHIMKLLGKYVHLHDPSKYDDLVNFVIYQPWLVSRLLRGDVSADIILEANRLNMISQKLY